ncbi:MAG: mechanosensitive ion channel family protein [Spirochaetota bacterium]|jgi:small-conductance mechanosensitive channel|nr:mechanosensitive ion channel family protein [Spirochaetota bacterium]
MTPFVDRFFAGNPLEDWLIAVGIVIIAFLCMMLFRRMVGKLLARLELKRGTFGLNFIAETITRSGGMCFVIVAMIIGSSYLHLADDVRIVLERILKIVIVLQFAGWMSYAVRLMAKHRQAVLAEKNDGISRIPPRYLGMLARGLIWLIAIALCMEVLGYNVANILAGLGIGGIVIALAAQNVVTELFATLVIVIDKPFVIGDLITFDDIAGKVEHIGLKTSRLRSINGEQILVGNQDLLKSRLRNYARLVERRWVFRIRVEYDTPPEILEQIPSLVRDIIAGHERARFDRAHFADFGQDGIEFEFAFYSESPEFMDFMNLRDSVNRAIFREFTNRGIRFAFPKRILLARGESLRHGELPSGKSKRAKRKT